MLGGMPTVCLRQVDDPAVWFKGFEQTYLERDVREMSQVGNLMALRALLRLTSLRTGQLLSPSQLGRDAKLSAATTFRYLSLFEASFLITRIPPYLRNRASRLIKSPKLYLSDSGLAGYLAGMILHPTPTETRFSGPCSKLMRRRIYPRYWRRDGEMPACIFGLFKGAMRWILSSRPGAPAWRLS